MVLTFFLMMIALIASSFFYQMFRPSSLGLHQKVHPLTPAAAVAAADEEEGGGCGDDKDGDGGVFDDNIKATVAHHANANEVIAISEVSAARYKV